MDVSLPDGTIIRGVPDGTTREQLTAKLKANGYTFDEPKPEPGIAQRIAGGVRDLAAGAVRGAGSIGATILAPIDVASDAISGQPLMQSNNERRTKMDSALSGLTGADPNSMMYGAGKLTSEVAGTMGAGGAVANGIARLAPGLAQSAPALVQAIRTGGFSTGQRVAPGVMNALQDAGIRAAGGAINGGVSTLMVDPQETPMGIAAGAAVPVAVKAAGAVGRSVGQAVSGRLAKDAAVRRVVSAVGDEAVPQTVADIQTYYPKGAEDIPVSASAITQNPALARLEQGSRLRAGDPWYNFDQEQGKAVFGNVLKATQEADQLGARLGDRQDNWRQAWESASENMRPRLWVQRMTQFGADMESALRSPESSNPAVRSVLDAINAEMDRLGPNFGLGNLQQLRANLNGKVQPTSTDVFKSAPRDNPAIISLKQEMDDILNTATGGKWQKVLEGYAKDSEAVHASKAAQKVRNAFIDPNTGRVEGVALNPDTPKITEAGLGRAMDAARMPDGSLALSPEATGRLESTLGALRRQNIVQSVKRTATAGGGSDTMSNALAEGAARASGAPNMLLQLLDAGRKIGMGRQDNALAALLSDPNQLAVALSDYLRPQPVSRLGVLGYRSAPVVAGRLASGQ